MQNACPAQTGQAFIRYEGFRQKPLANANQAFL
jgi:hypothetical protein